MCRCQITRQNSRSWIAFSRNKHTNHTGMSNILDLGFHHGMQKSSVFLACEERNAHFKVGVALKTFARRLLHLNSFAGKSLVPRPNARGI